MVRSSAKHDTWKVDKPRGIFFDICIGLDLTGLYNISVLNHRFSDVFMANGLKNDLPYDGRCLTGYLR